MPTPATSSTSTSLGRRIPRRNEYLLTHEVEAFKQMTPPRRSCPVSEPRVHIDGSSAGEIQTGHNVAVFGYVPAILRQVRATPLSPVRIQLRTWNTFE